MLRLVLLSRVVLFFSLSLPLGIFLGRDEAHILKNAPAASIFFHHFTPALGSISPFLMCVRSCRTAVVVGVRDTSEMNEGGNVSEITADL